jgi:hypothetical protein
MAQNGRLEQSWPPTDWFQPVSRRIQLHKHHQGMSTLMWVLVRVRTTVCPVSSAKKNGVQVLTRICPIKQQQITLGLGTLSAAISRFWL